jgi:hypothetical protein
MMNKLRRFLKEDVALTAGSQRVFSNKELVAAIARILRNEAAFNPARFPRGTSRIFDKSTDEKVAHWFLENLDSIEKKGYDGVVYSSNGADVGWVTKSYINRKSNWEDITGNLNMILADWYALKNKKKLLEPHRSIDNFAGINYLSQILKSNPTYAAELESYKDQDKKKALRLLAKAITVVDNDDYRIAVSFNKPGSRMIGEGSGWCTVNATQLSFWHNYANRSMLFVFMPYGVDEKTGKKKLIKTEVEVRQGPRAGSKIDTISKFQFDAGSGDFMDIGNIPVRPTTLISEKYPYLYDDLVTGLQSNSAEIKAKTEEWKEDPTLNRDPETKVKEYDVNKEIAKLSRFRTSGYFTDTKRPAEVELSEPDNAAQPQIAAPAEPQQPEQAPMESIRELAERIIVEDLGIKGSVAGPTGTAPTPELTIYKGKEIMENVDQDVAAMMNSLKKYDKLNESVLGMVTLGTAGTKIKEEGNPWEDLGKEDKELKPGESEKSSTGGTTTKTKTGLVHTQNPNGRKADKEVDEDVEEELDEENEEKPDDPALTDFLARGGKVKVGNYNDREEKKNLGKTLNGTRGSKSGSVTRGRRNKSAGLNSHVKSEGATNSDVQLAESADQDVLDWMSRFAKLGNMKGYGK